MPAKPLARSVNNDSSDNGYLSHIATATSRRNQAMIPIILFPLSLIVIGTCIGMIVWLAVHGPALVPGQDTRITAIIISVGSRLAGLFIGAALVRSAWAAFLPHVLAGELIPTRALVGVCRNFMSLGQLENYGPLPSSFKYHIILAAFISLAMIGTSASFRYDSLGLAGRNIAISSRCCKYMQPVTRYSGIKLLLQWRNGQYQPKPTLRIIVELFGGSLYWRSTHSLSIRGAGRSGARCKCHLSRFACWMDFE